MPTDVLRRAPRAISLDSRSVRRIGNRMLAELGLSHAELSVLLTDDGTIRELNSRYRGKDRPTDVLAFPLETHGAAEPTAMTRVLGDVVISIDTAHRQSLSRKRPLLEEVRLLMAHGLLHLLGHDHATPAEKREMVALTRRLVRASQAGPGTSGHPRGRPPTHPGGRSGSRWAVRRRAERSPAP